MVSANSKQRMRWRQRDDVLANGYYHRRAIARQFVISGSWGSWYSPDQTIRKSGLGIFMRRITRYVVTELLLVFLLTLTAITLLLILAGVAKEGLREGLGLDKGVATLRGFAAPRQQAAQNHLHRLDQSQVGVVP